MTADGTLDAYLVDEDNYSDIKYDNAGSPSMGWHVPIVTGTKSKVSFGAMGLDFEEIWVQVEPIWEANDEPISIVHNHTDIRLDINATSYNKKTWEGT